ncbi:MAG TPA: MlaD family protein [Elusimicrobiales bacterium]|nr:MlaD family protein [Elusimicrobiales bacterium]
MNGEMKVGLFVIVGSVLFGTAIFLLGDYSFQKYYTIYAEFSDVGGLPDKSIVKLSGVEVGKIKQIYLKDEKVIVQLAVREGVKIYKDATFLVGATSMIGSKFLQVNQGRPSAGVIEPGTTMKGEESLQLDRALARAVNSLEGLVGDIRNEGRLARDINVILSNLREVTGNVNDLVSNTRPHAEKTIERVDSITAKLDDLLTKTDAIVEKINRGDGVAGALVSDPKMKDNVSATLTNLRDASASAKDALGRIGGFRTYLRWDYKYEALSNTSKNNFGVKISPREGRYYYLGGANMGNRRDRSKSAVTDYETLNTIDAQLGWEAGNYDFYAGALHGAGGGGLRWKPFYNSKWDRLSVLVEASDFSRNRVIKRRHFNDPRYDVGVDVALNKYVSAGVRLNDLAETKRVNYTTRLVFEDKDIAYLFGFASLGSFKKN